MAVELMHAPFPLTYRELWLPRGIKGWTGPLPSSRYNGHEVAFTGARHGTTCDGVHFTGAATSNINCGAIHNAAAKLWVSFRFKLDQNFSGASPADMQLFAKTLDGNNSLACYLESVTGELRFIMLTVGVVRFDLRSAEVYWVANQWYHVLASLSDVGPAQRLIIDGGTPVVDTQPAFNIPNGGDFVIGDNDDPGAGEGLEGTIADFVVGTDDLSQAAPDEEYDLYAGIPPADAVNFWPLDEGRGLGAVAIDRGTGGNNGTLDTSCTWAFGQVQQPLLSLDGINDVAISSAGVDISGDATLVWVGKMKSTYDGLAGHHMFIRIFITANDYFDFLYNFATDTIEWTVRDFTIATTIPYAAKPNIDDYLVLVGTRTLGTVTKFFVNGSLVGTDTGDLAVSAAAATAYLGRTNAASNYDISKPLLVGLIDGAFTPKQVLTYSRYLRNVFNLPITI